MLRVIYRCQKPTIARVQGDVTPAALAWWPPATWPVSVDCGLLPVRGQDGPDPRHHQPLRHPCHGVRAAAPVTAERFGAQEALRIGFVHEVVTRRLDAKVDAARQALISASPNAVRACKSWCWTSPNAKSTPP